jgi:hypothetical protein
MIDGLFLGEVRPGRPPFRDLACSSGRWEVPAASTQIALPAVAAQTQPRRARAPYTEPAAHGLEFEALPPAAAGSFHIQTGMPPRFHISMLRLRENRCA